MVKFQPDCTISHLGWSLSIHTYVTQVLLRGYLSRIQDKSIISSGFKDHGLMSRHQDNILQGVEGVPLSAVEISK
jgi:hypothetical protein